MGRRNTKLELTSHSKQKLESLARDRPAGRLPGLSFDRVQPNGRFSRGGIVELTQWMVLHRPVELGALIRSWCVRFGHARRVTDIGTEGQRPIKMLIVSASR